MNKHPTLVGARGGGFDLDVRVVEHGLGLTATRQHPVMASFATPESDRFMATAPVYPDTPLDFGSQSCERLAARLVDALTERCGRHRRVRCTVTEDGLLGAGVAWDPAPATASEPGS